LAPARECAGIFSQGIHKMSQQMFAEILFLEAPDLGPGIIVLRELGFSVELLPYEDVHEGTRLSSAIWIVARIESELDEDGFFDWVRLIADEQLHNADLLEAGLADPQPVSDVKFTASLSS
jgi:hypothetical protein